MRAFLAALLGLGLNQIAGVLWPHRRLHTEQATEKPDYGRSLARDFARESVVKNARLRMWASASLFGAEICPLRATRGISEYRTACRIESAGSRQGS